MMSFRPLAGLGVIQPMAKALRMKAIQDSFRPLAGLGVIQPAQNSLGLLLNAGMFPSPRGAWGNSTRLEPRAMRDGYEGFRPLAGLGVIQRGKMVELAVVLNYVSVPSRGLG